MMTCHNLSGLRTWRAVVLLVAGVFTGSPLPAQPIRADAPATPRQKADRSAQFFADRAVRVFQVELSAAAMDSLRLSPRNYVSGTVREGGQVFTNVAIHLKGMGSFRPLEEKPSLVLNFDKFVPDREYCGLTKLMLNNSVQDQTYVAELLATDLFRDAGVPAARVTHARVMLNGRDLGLCVAIEGMNKHFLKRHFKDSKGNLYEGYLRDIDRRLDQDAGPDTTQADVSALLAACRVPDPSERFGRLKKLIDVDRFVSFAAIEVLISHWDGYTLHTNNYRLYHDPATDQMVFIAHGLDASFRRLNVSVQPPMRSVVSRALFRSPQGRQLYEQRLRNLYTNVFQLAVITNRMDQALAKLRAASLPADKFAEIERQAGMMRTRIAHRASRIRDQLAGIPPAPLAFDGLDLAHPEGWRDEYDRGEPLLDRVPADGRAALHIQARGGRSRASWRSMIYLKPGRYQFEGQARTAGITGGYVSLRISGDQRSLRITGSNSWMGLRHPFVVEEEAGDVELVCEFYAEEGEVWFDVGSLRVRRF